MGYGYQYDTPGRTCSGGPTPGAIALRDAALARWPGLSDLGIYNCRLIVGGTSLSTHGEGRAADFGTTDVALGDAVASWMVAAADALGVQEVIWNRRRWDSRRRTWAPYSGENPHTDHVHVALCRAAAGGLDPATAAAGVGAGADAGADTSVLAQGSTWIRVAGVVVGLVLVALAVVFVVKDLKGHALGRAAATVARAEL